MILIKKYRAKIVLYNFDQPYHSYREDYDNPPTKEELKAFWKKINPRSSSTIHVEEFYKIIRN